MARKKLLRDFILRCSCGRVVKLLRRRSSHQANRAFLCNGTMLRGRIGFCPPFDKQRVQYEVRVIRSWEPTGYDRYILYHVNKELQDLLFLSRMLGISQTCAVWIFNRLSGIAIRRFVTFRNYNEQLSLTEAVERWAFISQTEFTLLNATSASQSNQTVASAVTAAIRPDKGACGTNASFAPDSHSI